MGAKTDLVVWLNLSSLQTRAYKVSAAPAAGMMPIKSLEGSLSHAWHCTDAPVKPGKTVSQPAGQSHHTDMLNKMCPQEQRACLHSHVHMDERPRQTGISQTGLRW